MERQEQHKVLITFAAEHPIIKQIDIEGIHPDSIIYEPSAKGDSLTLWLNLRSEMLPDSLEGEMIYMKHDSLRQLQPDTTTLRLNWMRTESKQEEREREKMEKARAKAEAEGEEWKEPDRPSRFAFKDFKSKYEVNPEKHYPLNFTTPLTQLDTARIKLLSWSEKGDTIVEPVTLERDSVSLRRWYLKSDWNVKRQYNLQLPKGVMRDIAGELNDSVAASLTVADIDKFAKINLNIKARSEGAQYVVQFVDGEKNKKISIDISNYGIGISKEDIPHIFDRFYKTDKSRGLDKSGVGLGLYISKTIIDAHGENIWVDSVDDVSTEFTFTLKEGTSLPKRKAALPEGDI